MPAQMTLIEMVKDIMSDMDSDAVTSISDTVESAQVAQIVEDIYWQMVNNNVLPELQTLNQLETMNLTNFPGSINYLAVPNTLYNYGDLMYNIKQSGDLFDIFRYIPYITPHDFLKLVSLNESNSAQVVQVTDPVSGVQYYITNNSRPTNWTSFDDKNVAFNSIDMGIDTVQVLGTKSIVWGKRIPTFTQADDFIPDVDPNFFPYFLAEAKATCFVNLKQQANAKIQKQSDDQRIRLQNHKFKSKAAQRTQTGNTGPNFGRKAGGWGYRGSYRIWPFAGP